MSRGTLALVVDASVARSAGEKDAVDPTACACRDVLTAMLEAALDLAMSHRSW